MLALTFTGRTLGHSPHPLFEPSIAWPDSWENAAAWGPLARHLRGQTPPSGAVHPGLTRSWAQLRNGRPRWLTFAAEASADTLTPLRWADPDTPVRWSVFRREALSRAAETQRLRQIRRDNRVRLKLPIPLAAVPRPILQDPGGDEPLVSVVMATWNRAPIIRRAIESVMAQSLPDWELIVVDDGSDDDTLLVLEGLARRDSRIRVLPLPHGGVCRARNHGLAAARGRWVAFLDSDNTWEPPFLRDIVGFAQSRQTRGPTPC